MTDSRVPSFSLSITHDDAERMAEASRALQECLSRVSPKTIKQDPGARDSQRHSLDRKGGNLTLHSMLVEAAQNCKHPLIVAFLPRMISSGLTKAEANAGIVLFHEMDKSSKLKLVFDVLASASDSAPSSSSHNACHIDKENKDNKTENGASSSMPKASSPASSSTALLSRDRAKSLFKTVLMAISCCVLCSDTRRHRGLRDDDNDVIMKSSSRDDSSKPPKKAIKMESKDSPSSDYPSSSFDSSPAVLKGDDKGYGSLPETIRQQIEETASDAAARLVDFTSQQRGRDVSSVSFEAFGEWYNAGGCSLVPWLELLHLSKWKISATSESMQRSSQQHYSGYNHSASHHQSSRSHSSHHRHSRSQHHHSQSSRSYNGHRTPPRRSTPNVDYKPSHGLRRTLVSFDFSGDYDEDGKHTKSSSGFNPLSINISTENVVVLRNLVRRTGLIYCSASDICKSLLIASNKRILPDGRPFCTLRRSDFRRCIRDMVSPENNVTSSEMDLFSYYFEDFFTCFEGNHRSLHYDEANAKELAVGFCFLSDGKKSTKLATGFELLDNSRSGFLSHHQMIQYLQSYLTMLVAMSLLRENPRERTNDLSPERLREIRVAVEHGAHWTLKHFLRSNPNFRHKSYFSFETFADWYSHGGYNVAPWLELLDLKKLISLISDDPNRSSSSYASTSKRMSTKECRSSHRRQYHSRSASLAAQVLFTFPLANRSLVVLKDDATYVNGVVEQLGLLSLAPEDIWSLLTNELKRHRPLQPQGGKSRSKRGGGEVDKTFPLDQGFFVDMMERVFPSDSSSGRKRSSSGSSKMSASVRELLSNFFHSFDLKQENSVAINELMGGLTLLCGGKKSTKLSFAFGVFDSRVEAKKKGKNKANTSAIIHSLNGADLFLFLRSFLIVMFSCCAQSLDMDDSSVDRCICETANMVVDHVMQHQWDNRKKDRIDFDEFGEWYNEGGFELAPWLELLDLKKWVLLDSFEPPLSSHEAAAVASNQRKPATTPPPPQPTSETSKPPSVDREDMDCPPPPPEEVLDPSFFDENSDDIMQIGSMDEMDIMLMQEPSHEKDEMDDLADNSIDEKPAFEASPKEEHRPSKSYSSQNGSSRKNHNSLKFHLVTDGDHGGFMLSVSQRRIRHLRYILTETGMHKANAEEACNRILSRARSKSTKSKSNGLGISKGDFHAAIRDLLPDGKTGTGALSVLTEILDCIFAAFDVHQTGAPGAVEIACGLIVLCKGKKSDKLEFAFEVLDKNKHGELSKHDMSTYLRSFLTVLLSIACTPALDSDSEEDSLSNINGSPCDRSTSMVVHAVETGSKWAVSQAFRTGLRGRSGKESITFDDFAEWYTNIGYSSVPWLELLDLHKWVLTD